ncbi:Probable dolichyl pyrophosphate Glc1Man9GlcNAc2 alpha-1,3-glucosyltransferase [Gryllus bimaculatus]|nr:Probable dolichyl pyrophosphate Glc1Man9GlcNAc2 alpha-1,3-glucosyltransferase [Gryllus bimaculatus]
MLVIKNINYASSETIIFQRLSVIITDLVFAYGTRECCLYLSGSGVRKSSKWGSRWGSPAAILQVLLLGNAGLLLVDHIHFQYNGFLFGLLLISIARVLQVFSRLFPFKRGLCHAYWAPNFWAIYNTIDKIATAIASHLGFNVISEKASMTGGLVQEFQHNILPSIEPKTTFLLTVLAMTPALVKLWRCPGNPLHFVRCVVLCACGSFMFGWHVHEKAVLLIIIPLSVMAVVWKKEAQVYLMFVTVGHYSLFPLLFTSFELPIKVLLLVIHSSYAFVNLSNLFDLKHDTFTLPLLTIFETLYILGLIPLFLYENIFHSWLGINNKLPFLPLMLTSIYCALGVTYSWLKYYWHFLTTSEVNHKRKAH